MGAFAWSFSAMDMYENCPKQFYHLRVAKDVKDVKWAGAQYGDRLHDAMKKRLTGAVLPEEFQFMEPLAKLINDAAARTGNAAIVEQKWAFNRDLQPVDFFAKDVWFRVVTDACVLGNNGIGVVFDWKTGKPKMTNDQDALCALGTFLKFPQINEVHTHFIYLGHGRNFTEHTGWVRGQMATLMARFFPRAEEMERAVRMVDLPPRPNGLCKKHCPVKSCPHNGSG